MKLPPSACLHRCCLRLGGHPLPLGLVIDRAKLCRVLLPATDESHAQSLLHPWSATQIETPDTPLPGAEQASEDDRALAAEAALRLQAWLDGQRETPDLPLAPLPGTPLQQEIRLRLAAIPRGQTRRYGELGPARCVARVCSCNPLPLILPCHRVLPAGGSAEHPGRYRGGSMLKRALLLREAGRDTEHYIPLP